MDSIIQSLENKGMNFTDDFSKRDAVDYISYNTSWNMLKKSRNLIKIEQGTEKYSTVRFIDIINAGHSNYYYSCMLKPLIDNFEHNIKVYMSSEYMKLGSDEKIKYNELLHKYIDEHHLVKIQSITKNDKSILKLHDKLMLNNLIEICNMMSQINPNLMNFDTNISRLRNKLYHHENVLKKHNYPHDTEKYIREITPVLDYFNVTLTKREIKILSKDVDYNELVWILKIFYYVDKLLSQHITTARRKDYMYNQMDYYLDKVKEKYELIDSNIKQEWVLANLSIIEKIFNSAISETN